MARTLSYAEGAPSSVFEGGSCVWVLSSRSPNPSEAIVSAPQAQTSGRTTASSRYGDDEQMTE